MLLKNIRRADGARGSLALEYEFWVALERIAATQSTSWKDLIQRVDAGTTRVGAQSLASAVRVFVVKHMLGNAFPSHTCASSPNNEG